MEPFERSWQNRLVCKRKILPHIRNQRKDPTCSFYASIGAVESVYKKYYAENDRDFDKVLSIESLTSVLSVPQKVKDVLEYIKDNGVLTEENFQEYSRTGVDDGFERLKIKEFYSLDPHDFVSDFVELMTHVLSKGTAVGVFMVTPAYDDNTIYYQEYSLLASDDPSEGEYNDDWEEDTDDEDRKEEDDEDGEKEEYEDEDEDEESEEDDEDGEKDEDEESEEDGEDVDDNEVVVGGDEIEVLYHAVLIISLGLDDKGNLYWRVLDSHGVDVGENGTRRIAVYLIKEAHIIELDPEMPL